MDLTETRIMNPGRGLKDLGACEIAKTKQGIVRQDSQHPAKKSGLPRQDQNPLQQKAFGSPAHFNAEFTFRQYMGGSSVQVENRCKRPARDAHDEATRQGLTYGEGQGRIETSKSPCKRTKVCSSTIENAQSVNEIAVSSAGVRLGGRCKDETLQEGRSGDADKDANTRRAIDYPPSVNYRIQTRRGTLPLTDTEELRRIGYLGECDKRDPEVVRSFHESMMQDILLPQDRTAKSLSRVTNNGLRDSRTIKPSNWEEVLSLQKALEPTRRCFGQLSGLPAPPSQLWDNYCSQWKFLQKSLGRSWKVTNGQDNLPRLVMLKRWLGPIRGWQKNPAWITPNIKTPDRQWVESSSTLANQQVLYAHQFHEAVTKELRQASDADSHRLEKKAKTEGLSQRSGCSKPVKDVLAKIVAKHPQNFTSWLATKGRVNYSRYSQTQDCLSLQDFCEWLAPSQFEYESNPSRLLDLGSVHRASTFDDNAPIANIGEACREVIAQLNGIRTKDIFMGTTGEQALRVAGAIQQDIRDGVLRRESPSYIASLRLR